MSNLTTHDRYIYSTSFDEYEDERVEECFEQFMEGSLDYIYGRPYDSERVEQGDMLYDLGHSKAKEISTTVEEDEEERLSKIYKPYHRGWVDRVV